MRKQLIALALAALAGSGVLLAGEFGTPQEARAMLDRVVAAMEADQAKALEAFTKGADGFKDRDLYPFCIGPDGNFSAHPKLVGKDATGLKDKAGEPLGEKLIAARAAEGVSEVAYVWVRPGSEEPVGKVAYVTSIGDQICAVGYYK
jgi:signal transduction histidine kinase